jgi:hypothetical protein
MVLYRQACACGLLRHIFKGQRGGCFRAGVSLHQAGHRESITQKITLANGQGLASDQHQINVGVCLP